MGLKLTIKPGERLIINGCVIRNGDRRLDIEIETRADVLRGNEMLNEENSRTPVRRLLYLIQIVLVSRDHRARMVPEILGHISQLEHALEKSQGETLAQVRELVEAEEFYTACRKLIPVMRHEDFLLALPLPSRKAEG